MGPSASPLCIQVCLLWATHPMRHASCSLRLSASPCATLQGSQELDSAGLTADDRRTLQEMEETRRRAQEGAMKQQQEGSRAGAPESWNQDGGAA